jgi:hypothetical protein
MSRPPFGFRKALQGDLPDLSNFNVLGERSVSLDTSR